MGTDDARPVKRRWASLLFACTAADGLRRKLKPPGTSAGTGKIAHCVLVSWLTLTAAPTDDPSLHNGRIRAVPHVEGQWSTHVYLDSAAPDWRRHGVLLTSSFSTAAEGSARPSGEADRGCSQAFASRNLGAQLDWLGVPPLESV